MLIYITGFFHMYRIVNLGAPYIMDATIIQNSLLYIIILYVKNKTNIIIEKISNDFLFYTKYLLKLLLIN